MPNSNRKRPSSVARVPTPSLNGTHLLYLTREWLEGIGDSRSQSQRLVMEAGSQAPGMRPTGPRAMKGPPDEPLIVVGDRLYSFEPKTGHLQQVKAQDD